MRASRMYAAIVVLGLLAGVSARAEVKIATANTAKIFEEMQEKKDAQQALDNELNKLKNEDAQRKQALQNLKSQRDQLKTDSKQYQELNQELLSKAIEYDAWARIAQANAARQQKMMMVDLFKKIRDSVGAVAKQKGVNV